MKIKNKLNGIVILVLCFTLISLAILPCISLAAPTTYSVYFNGGIVANGGSVHYQGNSGITIGIKVPDATDFYVTFDGTTGDTSLNIDGGGYNEYTLSAPSGAITFNVVADGVALPAQIINFYHDTVVDPNAKLSYVSVKLQVFKVNNKVVSPFIVDYDGYTNTGADLGQVKAELEALGYDKSGKYELVGELQVAVFVNGSSTPDGIYWAKSDESILFSKYNWGVLEGEVRQRGDWGETKYIEPKLEFGGDIIRVKDIDSRDLIANSQVALNIKLPENTNTATAAVIDGYETEGIKYIMWYGEDEAAEGLADSQTLKDYTGTLSIDLKSPSQKYCFIYFFYTKKVIPGKGSIITEVRNIDSGKTLYINNEANLNYGTYTRSFLDLPPIKDTTFVGSIATYDLKELDPAKMAASQSQTVILDENNKAAYIIFYVKEPTPTATPTPSSTPSPTPTPSPSNIPPVAVINSADKVMMGDDIDIMSGSYDTDGYITKYRWNAPDAKTPIIETGSTTWFDKVGIYTIGHSVTDNKAANGSTAKQIEVLPPMPKAVITYTGRTKENYKITLDSTKSISPKRYPVDSTKTTWNITAVSGCSDSDIKYLGGLNGMSSKDFLVKKMGRIKVALTVTNTAGYSDTATTYIDISPNLNPVAQLVVPKRSIREYVDADGKRYGETTIYDTSYSPDGDKIIYRKYYCRYDSDNDDDFKEEYLDKFYEGSSVKATKRYYNNQGVGWCRYDIEVEEDLMEKDASGKYINTIPEFILPEDIKKASTFYI